MNFVRSPMLKRPILLAFPLLSAAIVLSGCEGSAASKNQLAKPQLNATGIARANAQGSQALIQALEKTYNCQVKADKEETKAIRLGGRDAKREESLYKNATHGISLLSNDGTVSLVIVELATNKALAQSRTYLSARRLELSHEAGGSAIAASCQEAGEPKVDPALDRSDKAWACESFLAEEGSDADPIPFEVDGSVSKASGPDGALAELTSDMKQGESFTLRLRKPGESQEAAKASADDSAGLLSFEGTVNGGHRARVNCMRGQ